MPRTEGEGFGPESIRALRGELSRAAFARRIGVTPLTVYRWELPDTAPQARRPRGRVAQALRQLADGQPPARPAAFRQELLPEETDRLSPCLARLARAEWRTAEDELLGLLASGALHTPGARALAALGLAYLHRWMSEDSRRAFTTLLPHLTAAEAGLLPESVEVQVHALAAVLFASPDGKLFDADKTAAHVARAEALLGPVGSANVRCLLLLAELSSAFYLGAPERIARQFGRLDEVLPRVTDPMLRLLAANALAHEALLRGDAALATRRLREVTQGAARAGFASLEARSLSFLAWYRLEEGCEPGEALGLVRRAREAASGGRLARGFSFIFAARAEAEALVRLARFAEAEALMEQGEAVAEELSWTPHYLVVSRVRLLRLTGRPAELRELASRLTRYTGAIQRALTHAYGQYVEAVADLAEGAVQRGAEGLAAAHARTLEVGGWPFLRRECLIAETEARVAAGQLEAARAVLGRAQRFLEHMPSAWSAALLRRHEGLLLAREGRPREAREKLEAALATFELAGELPESALTRHALALVAQAGQEDGARTRRSTSEEELRRHGLALPRSLRLEHLQPSALEPPPESAPRPGAELLVAATEKLSARGLSVPLLQRELLAAVERLLPGRAPRLEELDSRGQASQLLGERGLPASEWVELGEGCGRRLRLGVMGPLPADGRALLTALARLAGLALEVATLRGCVDAAPPPHAPEEEPEMPGFIAASPAMKHLKVELARLSGSRATVIITGESGSGKEVVARAIHQLSVRSARPYVAFNCAAVPRELFEGQLFGYRRGAFTGAASDHPGVIRAAHGGTLFLDEIGELPLELQPKLLRFLENGEVFPLGELRPVQGEVRVIAATHRDLGQMVREGRFREDLYYRLQVVPVQVPPLRERREDIVALARYFVRQLTPRGVEPPRLGPDALATLLAHPWPGNVRELRNVIERSLAFGSLPSVLGADRLRIAG